VGRLERIFQTVVLCGLGCGSAPQAQPASTPSTALCASTPATPMSATSHDGPPSPRIEGIAADLLRLINAQDGAGVVAMFGDSMRRSFPVEKTGPFIAGLIEAKGSIEKFTRDDAGSSDQHAVYRFHAERGDWRVEIHLDEDGKIAGLKVTVIDSTSTRAEPPVAKSSIDLALPFRGQWTVFCGGDRLELNHHVNAPSQRRAADLVIVGSDGKTHRGDGKTNGDYYAYGQDILAVADGEIVTVVDGVPENLPGELNSYFVPGNLVVMRHTGNLYSAYAHLEPAKMRVKVGTRVKRGTVLGLCGNSGNSSEPHLHFQLQDGPQFEKSWGVEAVFQNVTVARDGKSERVASYSFLKDDRVGEIVRK
jgi:murein DD-endopeptidase MepM/ murein hydrolase activator NlpD